MPNSVPLKCRCGKIRGSIEPAGTDGGRQVVCMCIDCQTYARWLGEPDELLDEVGGTEIYQTTPARVKIHEGREQIRCVRLSPKGTLRFYAGCCRTPLANMGVPAGLPFAGIPVRFIDLEGAGRSREQVLGPVTVRLNAKHATGDAPEGSHDGVPKSMLFTASFGMMWDRLRGEHLPNAFRTDDGQPIHEPEVISKEERDRHRSECGHR